MSWRIPLSFGISSYLRAGYNVRQVFCWNPRSKTKLRLLGISFGTLSFALAWQPKIGKLQMTESQPLENSSSNLFLNDVDELHKCQRHEEEYKHLHRLVASDEDGNPTIELLWRLARAAYGLSRIPGLEKNERKRLYQEAMVYIQKSLDAEKNNPEVHKWYAVIAGSASGVSVIKKALIVKRHTETALLYQPEDAMAHYILASWCYHVAAMNWFERRAVQTLSPGFPNSTFEEALDHFEKAESTCSVSASPLNLVTAAKCYLRTGQNDKAVSLLLRVKTIPTRNLDDETARLEADKIMKTLNAQNKA